MFPAENLGYTFHCLFLSTFDTNLHRILQTTQKFTSLRHLFIFHAIGNFYFFFLDSVTIVFLIEPSERMVFQEVFHKQKYTKKISKGYPFHFQVIPRPTKTPLTLQVSRRKLFIQFFSYLFPIYNA